MLTLVAQGMLRFGESEKSETRLRTRLDALMIRYTSAKCDLLEVEVSSCCLL